jgi:hypothetical protein
MRRALPWVLAGLGAALLVAGIALFWLANTLPSGWAEYSGSYEPLEPGEPRPYASGLTPSFEGGSVLWTGQHVLGAVLAVLGLLVLAAVGGWLLGRRAGRRESPSGGPPWGRV